MIKWEFTPAQAPPQADEWLPQQLRLYFGPGDSEGQPDSGGQPDSSGGFDSSSFFGDTAFSDASNFQSTDSGSNFASDGGGGFQSSDGGGSQSAGFSDSGQSESTSTDGGGGYLGGDTGGYTSGDVSSALFGDSYTGGAPTGMDLAGDSYSTTQGGNAPFGGGGGFPGGGFADSTTGQGFGSFFGTAQADPNQATVYGPPSITGDMLSDLARGELPPSDLAVQAGIYDIGQNLPAQQAAPPASAGAGSNPLANYLDSGMQAQVSDPTNAWQQAVNTVSQLNIDPQAQMIAAQELGRQNESVPTAGRGGVFLDADQGRARSGMDMEFNPFGMYQAPTQDQGRQGSLMDMLNAINPITQAQAQNLWNIDPVTGQMTYPQARDSFDARFGDWPVAPGWNPGQQLMGSQTFAPAQPFGGNPLAGRGDTFDTRFGDLPPAVNVNEAPYAGTLAGPDVMAGSRQQAQPQAQQQTPDMFDARFGDWQQGDQGARPGWNPAEQTQGVPTRGPSADFANAPQSLNEALQAAARGDPNVQTPAFANMPWGTTFAPPGLVAPDLSNMLFQTQNIDRAPAQTLDELRAEQLNAANLNRTMFDPTLFGPPQQFQAPPSREAPPNVPLPTANPLNPFERGQVNERPAALERGIDPQDRDAVARTIERAVTERAPVVEREASRPPLQVTVPGRAAPSQSRGSNQAAQQASRGDRSGLDALLAQARTAPTLAGRIAALDALNGAISAMRAAGLPNPYGRDPDPGINAALRMGR